MPMLFTLRCHSQIKTRKPHSMQTTLHLEEPLQLHDKSFMTTTTIATLPMSVNNCYFFQSTRPDSCPNTQLLLNNRNNFETGGYALLNAKKRVKTLLLWPKKKKASIDSGCIVCAIQQCYHPRYTTAQEPEQKLGDSNNAGLVRRSSHLALLPSQI